MSKLCCAVHRQHTPTSYRSLKNLNGRGVHTNFIGFLLLNTLNLFKQVQVPSPGIPIQTLTQDQARYIVMCEIESEYYFVEGRGLINDGDTSLRA